MRAMESPGVEPDIFTVALVHLGCHHAGARGRPQYIPKNMY